MNQHKGRLSACLIAMAAFLSTVPIHGALAQSTVSSFAVLGGAGVTCTTSSVVGDVGSLLSVTGFPPPTPALCTLVGTVHAADAVATAAFEEVFGVGRFYDMLDAMACDAAHNLTGQPLGGKVLSPGVYCFDTTADLTSGTLTLNGGGDSNAFWVFQVGTAITTGTASVTMTNGGQACNVFWQLGTAATIGTGTAFMGNILAGSAITFTGANSSLFGRALAKTAVTMTGTSITAANCGATPPPPPPPPCKPEKPDKPGKHDKNKNDKPEKCKGDHDGDDHGDDGDDDDDDDHDDDHGGDPHHGGK